MEQEFLKEVIHRVALVGGGLIVCEVGRIEDFRIIKSSEEIDFPELRTPFIVREQKGAQWKRELRGGAWKS